MRGLPLPLSVGCLASDSGVRNEPANKLREEEEEGSPLLLGAFSHLATAPPPGIAGAAVYLQLQAGPQ